MRELEHEVDFCVVGGGISGVCAAITAARHGARVALIQDRPVLGGNASSEIRMHMCGAHGKDMRETGLVEEIELENMYRNPEKNYYLWDSVLYEKVRFEPNIRLFLNASCTALTMDGPRIAAVRAWQLTTETWHTVKARYFADCSGDGILAPLSGAEFRIGREAESEYGEPLGLKVADKKTMGMSCLFQARETDRAQKFVPPAWAYRYPDGVPRDCRIGKTNFWWIEVGGDADSIHDTEELRDELLKIAFGVWDYIKNYSDQDVANWTLDWIGFLPGKRESRRYLGDHVITQLDVESGGRFDDIVAYGGWSMDDHHPAAFYHDGPQTIFHPAPSPWGIPFRSLYSRNVENLYCAGRNISATHMAMSSSRVMLTCALMGQAVGTAAAISTRDDLTPRGVWAAKIDELQRTLMEDDCYLPGRIRAVSRLSLDARLAASAGDVEPLRNGIDRPVGDDDNGWTGPLGGYAEYVFEKDERVAEVRLVFDSGLNRADKNCRASYRLDDPPVGVPRTMTRDFVIEAADADGRPVFVGKIQDNRRRLVRIPVGVAARRVRFIPLATWGEERVHVFSFEVR